MLYNSKIDENDLKKELRVIAEEIDMYDDSPEDIVHERLQEVIWREHSLGYLISGDKQTVLGFKRQDVLDFMKQYYTADRMTIAISGYFEEQESLKHWRIVLEALRRGIKPRFWKLMRRLQRHNTIHPFICSIKMWNRCI